MCWISDNRRLMWERVCGGVHAYYQQDGGTFWGTAHPVSCLSFTYLVNTGCCDLTCFMGAFSSRFGYYQSILIWRYIAIFFHAGGGCLARLVLEKELGLNLYQ